MEVEAKTRGPGKAVTNDAEAPGAEPAKVGASTRAQDAGSRTEGGEGTPAPAAGPAATPKPAGAKPTIGKIDVTTEPAPGDPSTSRTTLGVGEKATFNAPEEGTWTFDGKDLGTGRSIEWTAPPTGTVGNLKFEPYLTSPNTGASSSLPILVLAPSKLDFKKVGAIPASAPGKAGVGMLAKVTVGPTKVSFGAAEWLEQSGPAENVTGYFAEYVKTGQSLAHPANPNWLPIGKNNDEVLDQAFSKDKPKLMHPTEKRERWWAGTFQWKIPTHYRVNKGAAQLIDYVTQTFSMDDSGAMTVTKGGASTTAAPGGGVGDDLIKFPTLEDAKRYLSLHGRGGCIQAMMAYKDTGKADATSLANLITAITSYDIALYTYVKCKNTFSWTDPDTVSLAANGKPSVDKEKKINTGEGGEFKFSINQLVDLKKMTSAEVINISATVKDNVSTHPLTFALAFPFSAKDAAMSSDRYTISAFLK